jgi:hypothetical protein
MSIFRNIFRRKRVDINHYFQAMVEMSNESDRTYRNMIEIYLDDINNGLLSPPVGKLSTGPTGEGLFKARLFGALFMVVAYAYASQDEEGADKILQASSGLAIEPLLGDGDVTYSREKAKAIVDSYVSATLSAIRGAIKQVPIMPDTNSPEFDKLVAQLNDALKDSIGSENFTTKVQDRFSVLIRSNCAHALHNAARWASL